eukprot:Partr_v1_DN26373_c3_g2_i2_m43096 putative ubiquitin ligase complex F-box protein
MKTINDLPAELLTNIFEYVNDDNSTQDLLSCALVNHKWSASTVPVLWRNPKCHRGYQLERLMQTLNEGADGKTMFDYRKLVHRLSFGHFLSRSIKNSDIDFILLNCGDNIRCLNIAGCSNITSESLEHVANHCKKLESLSLEGSSNSARFTDESLRNVFTRSPALKKVGLFQCSTVSDDSIKTLTETCSGLNEVLLVSCKLITDKSIKSMLANTKAIKRIHITSNTITECDELVQLARKCRVAYINVKQLDATTTIEDGVTKTTQCLLMKNTSDEELQINRSEYKAEPDRLFF